MGHAVFWGCFLEQNTSVAARVGDVAVGGTFCTMVSVPCPSWRCLEALVSQAKLPAFDPKCSFLPDNRPSGGSQSFTTTCRQSRGYSRTRARLLDPAQSASCCFPRAVRRLCW